MRWTSEKVARVYYLLSFLSTLAASFIWGINTLFLLDAGLSNTTAFAANAFFTVGQVIFEIPTGIVADTRGRGISYCLGAGTLFVTTVLYFLLWKIHGPFWAWALVSALLGLGFTFFSGATEAWLVDALQYTNYQGKLESVFARGQALSGAAMLIGSVSGGFIAQYTNLGVPYIIRAGILAITCLISLTLMRDLGFSPTKGKRVWAHIKSTISDSIENGWNNPPVKFMILSSIFTGVGIYVFYAMQPYLLELYGKSGAYGIAGLAAAIVAGAQIVGSMLVPKLSRVFRRRTVILIVSLIATIIVVALLGIIHNFWIALLLLVVWGLLFAVDMPVRQAYINGLIPSEQRATVLSFDSMFNSAGGAGSQPILGRIADRHNYATSFIASSAIQIGAIPFLLLARYRKAKSDQIAK